MKKLLKVLGVILAIVIVVVIGFLSYINFKEPAAFSVPTVELKVEVTPERVANGQKMASMLCIQCHSNENNQLTGKLMKDVPKEFGDIYSKNITQHPEKGIGNWTDGQLYVMLRTGIKPNGKTGLFMPKFPLMADEDVKDIIAWLRSDAYALKPTEEEAQESQPSLLGKFLRDFVFKPTPIPTQEISRPDTTNLVAVGEYVVNKKIACYACHSKDFKTINELDPTKSEGYCGGGNPMLNLEGQVVLSSNITFDESGIGTYSEDDFIQAVKYGKKKNGEQVRYPMIPHTQLSDTEVKGIYAYLKTIPKLKQPVQTK